MSDLRRQNVWKEVVRDPAGEPEKVESKELIDWHYNIQSAKATAWDALCGNHLSHIEELSAEYRVAATKRIRIRIEEGPDE